MVGCSSAVAPTLAPDGRMTMTTDSCNNGATTLSRVNFSENVERVTIFGRILTIACCLVG